jgi:hypothetical protein
MNNWHAFLALVRDTCPHDIDSSKWTLPTKDFSLINSPDIQITGQLFAPFRIDDMGEDFVGGINIILISRYLQIERMIVTARLASGDKSPWSRTEVYLGRLLPRDVVYGGNVFPFTSSRDMAIQLDELIEFCEKLLYPVYIDMQNQKLFTDWKTKPALTCPLLPYQLFFQESGYKVN